jgi:hypothetical protein
MLILFLHEVFRFARPRVFDELAVETSRVGLQRTMPITFNISIAVPCSRLHLDAFDFEGNQQTNTRPDIHRQRIDENGVAIGSKDWLSIKEREIKGREKKLMTSKSADYCGSCYSAGAKRQCCNSCDDVIEAFKSRGRQAGDLSNYDQCVAEGFTSTGRETCSYFGSIRVARVQGVLFFALLDGTRPGEHKKHDLSRISPSTNLSHTISSFHFGPKVPNADHPLDDLTVLQNGRGWLAYRYHLNVVPVKWISKRGFEVITFKFTPAFSQKNITIRFSKDVPGIYFYYDLAPISVISKEQAVTVWQLVTSICAIVGGAFTCAALADQFLFVALSTVAGKRRIGKDV